MSVVLRPPADSMLSRSLDSLTAEAAQLAGPGHWHTGRPCSAHLTVRALETYRASVDPAEPAIERYHAAMMRAATRSCTFRVTGLTLTPGTVMACATPLDGEADLFMDRLAEELGPDAWHELPDGRRDIWYVNLLHFTTDIGAPEALIDWVAARRSLDVGETVITTAELVRFHHTPAPPRPFMRPEVLAHAPLN